VENEPQCTMSSMSEQQARPNSESFNAMACSEDLLRLARMGFWEFDAEAGCVDCSPYLLALLGTSISLPHLLLDDFLSLFTSEDFPLIQLAIFDALEGKDRISIEVRPSHQVPGEVMSFRCVFAPVIDPAGRVRRVRGYIQQHEDRPEATEDASGVCERISAADARDVIPICAVCKKIRAKAGTWHAPEVFLSTHYLFLFTHGLCPECLREYYPAHAKAIKEPTGANSRLSGLREAD